MVDLTPTTPSPVLSPRHSPLLAQAGFQHAFFSRIGGVSSPPFDALNLSYQVGDELEDVQENWRRAAAYLGVAVERICVPSQVHGCAILQLKTDDTASRIARQSADTLVSGPLGTFCAVRTADCVPLLLADRRTGRVAAVHAGWKGIELGIVGAAVETLKQLGSHCTDLLAAVGPHISVRAFEVGPDVAHRLRALCPDPTTVESAQGDERARVNLLKIARHQLSLCGLAPPQIDVVTGCTHSDPSAFFSYRRDGARSGRMVSAIAPRQASL